jgi:hypothetical protein
MAIKTPINDIDFSSIKNNFIQFLRREQSQFKDYDFEGSNMSVLLDVLAYNTFMNNYYTNMAINEMFLDTAVLRNSLVSHAKELNYIPRSMQSARAVVRVEINDSAETDASITIPKFTQFSGTGDGETFSFVTDQAYSARRVSAGRYIADNVVIYEGEILDGFEKDGFFIDDDGALRCNLTNENIDTRTIEVFVDEEATEGENQFLLATDIFGKTPTSKVFYLAPYFDGRYSIYFGKDVYGQQPKNFEDIKVRYRICSGEEANGISRFSTNFTTVNGVRANVTTREIATSGAERESIESIRFFAPKSVQIQERAVTSSDYEVLLKRNFPDIQSISVYSGDELDPPRFGRVAVSVNLIGNRLISDTIKNEYTNFLSSKSPLSIEPIFVDPQFLYLDANINVYYSKNLTGKSPAELESIVRQTISTFSLDNLNEFGSTLRISRLSAAIDNSDEGILSNRITARPIIEYSPDLNQIENPRFNFAAELLKPYPFRTANGFSEYKPAVSSSVFSYNNVCALLQDDGLGNMQVISSDTVNTQVLNPNIGTVNYTTGEVRLVNFITDGYPVPAIKIFANTSKSNIIAPKSRVFVIRDADVTINMIENE